MIPNRGRTGKGPSLAVPLSPHADLNPAAQGFPESSVMIQVGVLGQDFVGVRAAGDLMTGRLIAAGKAY